ncbi:MAG: alpha/beta fold hydrolase [Aestuariibacter sp.]
MYRIKYVLLIGVLVSVILSISSCANYLVAIQMVSAPNDSLLGTTVNQQFEEINRATDRLIEINGFERQHINLHEEGIEISYFDIPAGDYGYTTDTAKVRREDNSVRWIKTHWQWKDKSCFTATIDNSAKGTLLMLHGWARDNRSLISLAVEFAQLGYRVVVPDLRGHGQSSGEWLSFGEQESTDIIRLADRLDLKSFDILGFSLGASTALQMASRDHRVNRVISIAAMHSIEETIPKFGARSRPWIASLLKENEKSIVSSASELTGINYQVTSDTLRAAQRIRIPTLLVYGEKDQMSDKHLNTLIFDSLSGQKQLYEVSELRHTFVLQHQSELLNVAVNWLGLRNPKDNLQDSTCPVDEFKQGFM